jgi:predicted nucleic acid-binding protein
LRAKRSHATVPASSPIFAPLEHEGATAKAAGLKVWLAGLVSTYDDKIIGLAAAAAALSGRAEARAIAVGQDPWIADVVIPGIAKAHDLVIVTRNTKHFLPLGAAVSTPDDIAGSPLRDSHESC